MQDGTPENKARRRETGDGGTRSGSGGLGEKIPPPPHPTPPQLTRRRRTRATSRLGSDSSRSECKHRSGISCWLHGFTLCRLHFVRVDSKSRWRWRGSSKCARPSRFLEVHEREFDRNYSYSSYSYYYKLYLYSASRAMIATQCEVGGFLLKMANQLFKAIGQGVTAGRTKG